jgi:hypothetical protein
MEYRHCLAKAKEEEDYIIAATHIRGWSPYNHNVLNTLKFVQQ